MNPPRPFLGLRPLRWVLLAWWLGATAALAGDFLSRVVELAGPVEFTRAGAEQWQAATTNLTLQAGDRLRTGKAGRATLQLSDRSVIRLDQSSLLEIQPPSQAPAQRKFRLNFGRLFFLNRERPADIEFETPLATGAIRGTEFVLAAAGEAGATELALLDGAVALTTPREAVELASGEQVALAPGQAAVKSRGLIAANLVQWCLYYPAVVDPTDLGLSSAEQATLAGSLAADREGDIRRALEAWPAAGADSESARLLLAGLKLAAGQVGEAVVLMDGASTDAPVARALREVIAAVKFQTLGELPVPTTPTAWLARSYYLQSRSDLPNALAAAQQAVRGRRREEANSPGTSSNEARLFPSAATDFGFVWARLAELEWSFGHRREALAALEQALALSPRNPAALVVRGFVRLDRWQTRGALADFDHALALDGTLGDAWLGRALCLEQLGEREEGRRALQVAATMEPQRSVMRSYLGKAWSANGEAARAEKEFRLARELDAGDPTPSLYEGLHLEQHNRFNEAVRALERSVELNDHRGVFRSRLLLDQDRSVRSADLAAAYDAVGLSETAERAAARALADSYANFSGHLFRAQSLQTREDPVRYNLRYETPRQSELLVANLLAPPGAGNLSQQLSQQDRLRWFGPAPVAASSLTEYSSRGDWVEAASLFGQVAGLGYALDSQFVSRNGDRPNQDFERLEFSLQAKQQLGSADSVYLQVGWMDSESGDVAQYYDPAAANPALRVEERQEPTLHLGWHHEWSPGSHTLLLASRLTDNLGLTDPSHPLLFLRQTGGVVTDVDYGGVQRDLSLENDFTLYSVELQHLLESPHHALVFGGRYQGGSVETASLLTGPLPPPLADQHVEPDFGRLNAYAYYHWRPLPGLQFTAGLSYDHLTVPRNVDLPPVTSGEADRDLVAPRLGILWSPSDRTHLRAAWTRSLGGLYFDDSVRLEPSQVAGFNQAFRSLIPESVAGLVPGTEFETFGLGLDHSFRSGTYLGAEAELLRSNGEREVGAVSNSLPIPLPDTPTSTLQTLDFEERSLALYATQLVGDAWSFGARYRVSEAELTGRFPLIPASASGAPGLVQDEAATLHQVRLFALFNHASGFFAQWQTDWYQQSNQGYTPARPGDDFWHHNLYVGYRFPRRRAEVRLGIQNLADQDYRLNPLNLSAELPRERTFVASLRLNF